MFIHSATIHVMPSQLQWGVGGSQMFIHSASIHVMLSHLQWGVCVGGGGAQMFILSATIAVTLRQRMRRGGGGVGSLRCWLNECLAGARNPPRRSADS